MGEFIKKVQCNNFVEKITWYQNFSSANLPTYSSQDTGKVARGVLFEFHLKFWNTASNGIPAKSLL